jgi:hypothetical protein
MYGKVALTGESLRFEHGSEAMNRWFDVLAFRTPEPQSRQVAILFKEITDRKQSENLLQQQEEQLRLFVKHSPAGVAMFDRQMRYMLVSDRWLASYGTRHSKHCGPIALRHLSQFARSFQTNPPALSGGSS